ncbi:MAG: hypothetical protein ACX93O_14750 [Flagellimonas sp.]
MLYWHYTKTNSNWIGDFAVQNCLVQQVDDNLLVFSLPDKNRDWGREYETCNKKDWVFYDPEYGNVVNQTSSWLKAKDENSCERPGEKTYRARYTIFAQKEPLNVAEGGGVRVKKIEMASDAYNTKTVYMYTNPDNVESGVTSYAPSKRNRSVPYISEMPNPMVIYEHVTTEKLDANDNLVYKKSYQFNVPKPLQHTQNGVLVENAFEIKRLQDENIIDVSLNEEDVDMNFSKFEVKDFSSGIGRLVQSTEYNSENQQVYKVQNSYLPQTSFFNQGIIKESFNSYKKLWDNPYKDKYIMTSSSKEKIPNVLTETSITANGHTSQRQFLRYDFYTGQVTETSSLLSNGKQLKSKIYPAYQKYPQMGSKVDNPDNKNMLAQEAATYHFLNYNDNWEVLNTSMHTWRDWGGNVWRKHKTYRWNGETDEDGFYVDFDQETDDNFNWVTTLGGNDQVNIDWEQVSEITKYNDFSSPLEVMDINGNLAATKMGYNDTKTIAVCNAGYEESFYSGAEDDDGEGHFGGGVDKGTASFSFDSHTGNRSLIIAKGKSGFKVKVKHTETSKKYKISLWAKNNNHENVRINVGGSTVEYHPTEKVFAGDWVQLNFYPNVPANKQVYVASVGGDVIVDDFRLHPVASSMNSYVYNEWDELTHILGSNNMATEYEYDEAGRLLRIYSEVENVDGQISGGIKKVKEYAYTYKEDLTPIDPEDPENPYDPLQLHLMAEDVSMVQAKVDAIASGGSGQYEYQWDLEYCQDPDPQCPGDYQPNYGSWGDINTILVVSDCFGTRAEYWWKVRDIVTQEIVEAYGSHTRDGCE